MEPITLTTARTTLSPPDPADIDHLIEAARDPELIRWTPVPSPYVRENAEAFFALVDRWWRRGTELHWVLRIGSQFAGMFNLSIGSGQSAEVGCWLTDAARGHGLAQEAMTRVLDFGFSDEGLGLVRIEVRIAVGNLASAKAAQGLGFRYEGLLRQSIVDPRGRYDGWIAALLRDDERIPQHWPIAVG